MKQIELYVPLTDNDSRSISIEDWNRLHKMLLQHFGGWSSYRVFGHWKNSAGIVHVDECQVYRIITEYNPRLPDLLVSIANSVKYAWKQESVLYTVSDIDATFV